MTHPGAGVARGLALCVLCCGVLAACSAAQQSDAGAFDSDKDVSPMAGVGSMPDFEVTGLPSGWRVQEALDSGVQVRGSWVTRRKTIIPPYADPDGTHVPYSVCAAPVEAFESGCSDVDAVLDEFVTPPQDRFSKRIRVVVSRGNEAQASSGSTDDRLMSSLRFDF